MERNIALTLTLGGTEQSISSINDLEAALKLARTELDQLEIGSEAFQKLSTEIQDADTQLKKLNDSAKGLKIDRNLDNALKAGRLVASSFGAATAALGLFGVKSETLAAAQVKALQALTLATTIADIATQKKTFTDLAARIGSLALAAATNASTVAMRTFFTVVAANPLGALLTVLGLVVGALIAFTQNTDEATDANEALNQSLEKTKTTNSQNLALRQAQGADEVKIANERLAGALRLQKILDDNFVKEQIKNKASKATAEAREKAQAAAVDVQIAREQLLSAQRAKDAKLQEQIDQAKKERDDASLKRLEEELRIRNELLKQTLDEDRAILAATLNIEEFNKADADVVITLEKRLDTLNAIKTSLNEYIPITDEVSQKFEDINKAIPGDKSFGAFLDLFAQVSKLFEVLNLPPTETTEELDKLFDVINKLAGAPDFNFLNDEAKKNLISATQNVKTLAFVINQLQQQGIEIDTSDIEKIADLRRELNQPFINPSREIEIKNELSNIEKSFVNSYVKLKSADADYQQAVKNGDTERVKILKNSFAETARLYLKAGSDGLMQYQNFADGVIGVTREVTNLQKQIQELNGVELTDYLLKNKGVISKVYEIDFTEIQKNRERVEKLDAEVQNRTFDKAKEFETDVIDFQKQLAKQNIDITKLTYEQKLALLVSFLNEELSEEEKASKKRQDERNKELDSYANAIQQFQGIMNNLQQTLSDFYDFQFDKLESRNAILQSQIVGDTALANQKRIDLEKQYQAEKLKLEKKAAKAALTISLLTAVANVANSITAALRSGIPVVSQIAAGINAAIGAVQVGIIAGQLSRIDSMQRGGKVKRLTKGQGGMVVGPSHEYGGVRFAQRGLELEGGEAVINRMSTVRYGDLLNEINMAGGGKPIINNNFDDSRLLEALAKQRSEPIRAFVVEQDITNKQSLGKRLDQLSQV
jgi:hypothetical protein